MAGKTFLIVGDSWSQGEIENHWPEEPSHRVVHRGLTQYLEDAGHTVYNRGILGSANIEAYWQTYGAFFPRGEYHEHDKFPPVIQEDVDYILWFVTDSLRDIDQNTYYEQLKKFKSIKKIYYNLIVERYGWFDNLAEQIQKKIYLIGGWIPVWSGIIKYNYLQNLLPDVHGMLVPGSRVRLTHPALHIFDYVKDSIDYAKNYLNSNELDVLKNEIIQFTDEWTYAEDLRRNHPEFFWPDGHHPNRHGHYKIFEHVCKELNLE